LNGKGGECKSTRTVFGFSDWEWSKTLLQRTKSAMKKKKETKIGGGGTKGDEHEANIGVLPVVPGSARFRQLP